MAAILKKVTQKTQRCAKNNKSLLYHTQEGEGHFQYRGKKMNKKSQILVCQHFDRSTDPCPAMISIENGQIETEAVNPDARNKVWRYKDGQDFTNTELWGELSHKCKMQPCNHRQHTCNQGQLWSKNGRRETWHRVERRNAAIEMKLKNPGLKSSRIIQVLDLKQDLQNRPLGYKYELMLDDKKTARAIRYHHQSTKQAVTEFNGVPQKMVMLDTINGREQFIFDLDEMILFVLPSELHLLDQSHLVLDGTFCWTDRFDDWAQVYHFCIKFQDGDRVFTYILLSALLKSKNSLTYENMLANINDLYKRFTGSTTNFTPLSIRMDHEMAMVTVIQDLYPSCLLVTCFFHFVKLQRDRFLDMDKDFSFPDHPLNEAFQIIRGLSFCPFQESELENSFFQFLENYKFRLSPQTQPKFAKYVRYLKRNYFGQSKWSFARGHHYFFYRDFGSDLTSNTSESNNAVFNQECHRGTKSIGEFCDFMLTKKRKDFERKRFVLGDLRYNLQKKTTREKWQKRRQIFNEFDSLPLFLQKERLPTFLYQMGSA